MGAVSAPKARDFCAQTRPTDERVARNEQNDAPGGRPVKTGLPWSPMEPWPPAPS